MGSMCCRRRSKEISSQGKTDDMNELYLENQKVNVFEIKRKLKQMRQDIQSITITNCESDRERFESVDIILLREDLQVCDFPKLQHVTIDFVRQIKNDPASKELQLLDDKLYDKALQTIAKDVKTHLVLKTTVEKRMLTINQQAFKDKRAFLYVMRKMKQLSCSLQKIVFQDIIILKKNIFFTFCQQMREIDQLEEIFIVNTNITEQQALQVQQLLRWKQKSIKVLVISGSNLSDCHLDILFFQKLKIEDLIQLDRLELKNCPQLWKSTNYIVLMRQYAAIKLKQQQENELQEQEISQTNVNSKKEIILPQNGQGKQLQLFSQSPAPSQKNSNGTVSSEKKDRSQVNVNMQDIIEVPKQPSISSIPSDQSSEAKYDNRHSRQLLIGQYLWEEENQIREERIQPFKGAINSQHFLGKPSEGKLIISADEGLGNVSAGGGQSSENQFFTQFLKSCFSELIDIDMCQVIDFSKFGYQNLNFEQKKQICSYIVDSNTIQVLAVQYDRLFFKELCEQISIKYKQKVNTYLKEQDNLFNKKNGEDPKERMKIELESISLGKFRSNLMSLESLKVIASKCEMFQFDSFCYLSFLSLFMISLEVDFQHQQIEDSIIFPSYEQILDYLKKMIKLDDQDNESDNSEDDNFAENDEINVAEQIEEHFNSAPKEQNINLKQLNQENKQSNGSNNNTIKQNQQTKNIPRNSNSQFQDESYEIFNNIQWIQALNSLQTTVQQLTFRNFSWQNVQNSSKEKSFSQFLFSYFSLTADSLMSVDFSDVDLSHSCLARLHQILNRVFSLYNLAKQRDEDLVEIEQNDDAKTRDKDSLSKRSSLSIKMESKDSQEKLSRSPSRQDLNGQKGFAAFKRGSTRRFSGKTNKSKKIQNSILEMNRNQMKSQYFLKRFRLKFSSEKVLPIQNILKIFAAMCKEVQISNASIGKISADKLKQSINNTANSTVGLLKQGTKQQQQNQVESQEISYQIGSQIVQKNEKINKLSNLKDPQANKLTKQAEITDSIDEQQLEKNNNNSENNSNSKAVLGKISLLDYQGFTSNDIVLVNSQLSNLTELSLVRCSLSLPALVQILQKITRFYNLQRLTISGNDLSKAVIQPLSQLLNQGIKDTQQVGNGMLASTKDFSRLKTTMGQSVILPKIPKLRLITQKISLLLRIQQSFKSTIKPQIGSSSSSLLRTIKNQKDQQQQANAEQQKVTNEKNNSTEMLGYCVGKIFQLQKLQYLDLSSNNFSTEQGKLLLDEVQARSEKLLQYKVQKQKHLVKKNKAEIESNTNTNVDQQPGLKTGFYSKFIEKQLFSNRRQSTLYQENSDIKKNFSKLNTKFFAGDEDADQCIKEKENEEESLQSSYSSSLSEVEEQGDNRVQQQQNDRQGLKAKTFNLRRLEKQVEEQENKEEEEEERKIQNQNKQEDPLQKPQSDLAQEKDNSIKDPLPKESFHSLWKMKSKFFRGDQSDITSNSSNFPKPQNANAKPKKHRIKKADVKYPEIQELYLQNNQLGAEITRDISKHLAIIFPRLKVLNLSAPKMQQKANFESNIEEEPITQKDKSVISFESTDNSDRIEDNQKISPQPNNKSDNFERLILTAGVGSPFNELEKIILNDLPWKIISSGRSSAFEQLFNLSQIREIDLSGSIQDNQTAEYLCRTASMFQPCPLKKLSLRNCVGLSSKSWKSLVFCFLDRFQDLDCLDLSGCNLNEKKSLSILEACSKIERTLLLTQLILSNNPKLKGCLRTFILQLTQTYQLSLQLLDLSSCELNDESCESMIQGLLAGNKARINQLNQSLQATQCDQNELKTKELLKKQATFALIKLLLFDNTISMKMMFLIQYCFVFQITEEDNILFNMQFASNLEQKQQLQRSISQLKRQKGVIYSLLFGQKYEDFTIKATSLMLGENILSSKKKADDLLVSSLRTFREVKNLDIFVNDKVLASFNQFLTGSDSYNNSNANSNTHKNTQSKSLQGGSNIKKSNKKTEKEEQSMIGMEHITKEEKDHVIGDEKNNNNNTNPNTQRVYESSNKQLDDNMFSLSSSRKEIKNIIKKEQAMPSPQRLKVRTSIKSSSSPKSSKKDNPIAKFSSQQIELPMIFAKNVTQQECDKNQISKQDNPVLPSNALEFQNIINNKELKPDDIFLFDDSDEWQELEEQEVNAKEGQEQVQRIKVNDQFKQSKGNAVIAEIVTYRNPQKINPKNSDIPQVDYTQKQSIQNNVLVPTKSIAIDKKLIMNLNQQKHEENEEDTNINPIFSGMDTRSLKHRSNQNPINLQSIESLTLKSHDTVGIISLLNFFSLVSSDLKKIDFSSITLTNSMFLKVITTSQRLFPSLRQIKFSNIHFTNLHEQNNFSQIANAIHSLLTNPQIHLISITSSSMSEQIFQAIVDIQASSTSKFAVRSLDMSKNEYINFSDGPRLAILEKVSKLNLSSCQLNDKKFNLRMSTWQARNYLSHIIDLDISDNKGLSPQFFQDLGVYISSYKIMKILNISHTAFYEEKQRKFSYGLNRQGLDQIQLEVLKIRGMMFSKQEGTLNLFKALAQLERLQEVDFSEMDLNNNKEIDLFHNYLRYGHIAKLSKVKKMYMTDCYFLFEKVPFYNFDSSFAFSEYNHCSMFLFSQFESLVDIDLSGCLNSRKLSHKFMQELEIMRNKRLLNYSIKKLNLSRNCISAKDIRSFVCNILYIFKNLATLNIRSLVRFEQNYVQDLLDALDSYQYFAALQEYQILQKKNATANAEVLKSLLDALQQTKPTNPNNNTPQGGFSSVVSHENNHAEAGDQTNSNRQYEDSQFHSNYAGIDDNDKNNETSRLDKKETEDSNHPLNQFIIDATREYQVLSLQEFSFSDISSDLINNKEVIDGFVRTCITNRNFNNLKEILIYQDYSSTANIFRLQSSYTESLLDLNEIISSSNEYQELNTQVRIGFQFKDAPSIIFLKTQTQSTEQIQETKGIPENKIKPEITSIVYNNNNTAKALDRSNTLLKKKNSYTVYKSIPSMFSQGNPTLQKQSSDNDTPFSQRKQQQNTQLGFKLSSMRVEYLSLQLYKDTLKQRNEIARNPDDNYDNQMEDSGIFENEDYYFSNNIPVKHKQMLVNQWNEHLFFSGTGESDEHQIDLWRQFQHFTKRLYQSKIDTQTHIALDYTSTNLKLLSRQYNIFLDKKFPFNSQLAVIFRDLDSIYVGNALYHFLVQVCQFQPHKDLIDFLIEFFIFIAEASSSSFSSSSELIAKDIRLPPFLILSETDARRIQKAFVKAKNTFTSQKKISKVAQSLFSQIRTKDTSTQLAIQKDPNEMAQSEYLRTSNPSRNSKPNALVLKVKQMIGNKSLPDTQSPARQDNETGTLPNNSAFRNTSKDNSSNKITCNYFYKSAKGCQEFEEIVKLKSMPPSTLDIEHFSVNGLKAVYMICYQNDYFIKGDISFDSLMFISTSLSFALREYFYKNYASETRQPAKSFLFKCMYQLADIFVDIDNYFKYDESINVLDEVLSNSTRTVLLFKFLIICQIIIIFLLCPLLAFLHLGPLDKAGLSYIMHFIFGAYTGLSLIFEIFLLKRVIDLTRHLIPDLCLVHQNTFVSRISDFFLETFMNIEIFSYKNIIFFQQAIFSVLAQLDSYQDMSFIIIAFNNEENLIGILAVVIIFLNKSTELFFLFRAMRKNSYSNLFFRNINKLYELAHLGALEGLSNLLDVISPHNVLRITDNFIVRMLLPKQAIGLTINKKIFNKITKVIYCDLPQIILQLLYSLKQFSSNSSSVQLSIALNLISIIKSLLVILTIKQSVLNQMDFDELAEQKAGFLQSQFSEYQQKEIEMFQRINSNIQLLTSKPASNNASPKEKQRNNFFPADYQIRSEDQAGYFISAENNNNNKDN